MIATAHTDAEKALVTDLGATETADHTVDLAGQVKDVDVVFHLAGDPAALLGVLRDGGRFVSTLIGSPDQLPAPGHTVVPVFANPSPATLDKLAGHHTQAETRVVIEKVYSFDDALDAIAHFAAGTIGKIVVAVA